MNDSGSWHEQRTSGAASHFPNFPERLEEGDDRARATEQDHGIEHMRVLGQSDVAQVWQRAIRGMRWLLPEQYLVVAPPVGVLRDPRAGPDPQGQLGSQQRWLGPGPGELRPSVREAHRRARFWRDTEVCRAVHGRLSAYPNEEGGFVFVGKPGFVLPAEPDLAAIFLVVARAGVRWIKFEQEGAVIEGLTFYGEPDDD